MIEAGQAFDPIFLIQLVPGPDRIIVEKQNFGDGFATHAIIKQNEGIGATGQPMGGRPVAGQFDQLLS